jgi:hypothetical protein
MLCDMQYSFVYRAEETACSVTEFVLNTPKPEIYLNIDLKFQFCSTENTGPPLQRSTV